MKNLLGKIRLRAARLSWRLLLGPVAGCMPQNYIFSVRERSSDRRVSQHLVHLERESPPEVEEWNFPKSMPAWFRRAHAFEQRDLLLLRDVYLAPASGAIWTSDGLIFGESIGSLNRALTFGKCIPEILARAGKRDGLDTEESPLVAAAASNYFHWLAEKLPSILICLQKYPGAKILVHPDRPAYVDQSLAMALGMEEYAAKIVVSATPVHAACSVFLGMPQASGFVRRSDLVLLRSKLLLDAGDVLSETPKRVFISRALAKGRSSAAEPAIEKRMTGEGFELVLAEKLSFSQQVKIFSAADEIAGLHGAGLANILFARPGTKVTEFFSPEYTNDCYARLALGLMLDYSWRETRVIPEPTQD